MATKRSTREINAGWKANFWFSCKLRGICPSCTGRGAQDGAHRLATRVLPHSEYRQWVVNYPFEMSQKLAFQPALISRVERLVAKVLREWAEAQGVKCESGGVLFRHRFGSNMNVQIHSHIVMFNGGYIRNAKNQLEFARAGEIAQGELAKLAEELHRRIQGLLARHGIAKAPGSAGLTLPDVVEQPNSGQAVRFQGLHLFVSKPLSDRKELEGLCRYLLRGGVDVSRLRVLPGDRYAYRLNRKDKAGRQDLEFTGKELMEKLASLIPAARHPTRRYFGVLAGGYKNRKSIIPLIAVVAGLGATPPRVASRTDWATLLRRVYGVDALACQKCSAQMKLVRLIERGSPCTLDCGCIRCKPPPIIAQKAA